MDRAALGVALRRYRMDHDRYPETLDALAPEYLARSPADPATDYHRRSDGGFELRSRATPQGAAATEWVIER